MALVDWKKVQRPAFSSRAIPTVLAQWASTRNLSRKEYPDYAGAMGILHLQNRPLLCGSENPAYRSLHLSWHTPSGWILSAELDLLGLVLDRVTVVSGTSRVQVYNCRGESVVGLSNHLPTNEWSLPISGSVVGGGGPESIVLVKVPAMRRTLPPHDPKILMTQQQQQNHMVEREQEPPRLIHFNRRSGHTEEICLSNSQRQPSWSVTTLAMHPSQEWLVVGTKSEKGNSNQVNQHQGIRIYCARERS